MLLASKAIARTDYQASVRGSAAIFSLSAISRARIASSHTTACWAVAVAENVDVFSLPVFRKRQLELFAVLVSPRSGP